MNAKSLVSIIVLIVLVGLAAYAVKEWRVAQAPTRDVLIQSEFSGRIVYRADGRGQDGDLLTAMKQDCSERGGAFNECGSPCAPDAETCVQVCAFTCELGAPLPVPGGWQIYENQGLGFSVRYPDEMDIQENAEYDQVSFTLIGPTQSLGTELYDGISVTVELVPMFGAALEPFAEARSQAILDMGEILDPVSATSIDSEVSYTYRVQGLGIYTHFVTPAGADSAYDISYLVSDPTQAGFQEVADQIIDSFTKLGSAVDRVFSFEECATAGNAVMESYPRRCNANGRTFVEDVGNVLEKMDLIRLAVPLPNAVIENPLTIEGEARGTWFFEASFPLVLTDWDGRIIAQHYATAQGEWMTEEFVSFESELEFASPYEEGNPDFMKRGSLILQKDNPSGLPEHDDALEIPVWFAE